MTAETPERDDATDGRRVFGVVAVMVILLAGVIGFFVGSNGPSVAPTISLLGVASLPVTPLSMTLYGMVLAAASLAGLFGLVTFAARYDVDADIE